MNYVVVDTDNGSIVFEGNKRECDSWAKRHNYKVVSNDGETCFYVLTAEQAETEGFTKESHES